jgi:PAS domain S-box-containing protein
MEGRIIECNEAYANMLGYSKEELQGFNFRQVATERWRQIEDEILTNKVLTRGFSDLYEVEYARKDGTVFPVNIRVWLSRSEGGEPEGMWALVRDINVRKKIESELRETRNYLSNLLNYANAPIIVWDPEFKITMFNRAFERLTGLSADDVVGKQLDMLFPRESKEEALNHIKRALEGEYWNAVEIPVLHSDRTVRVVLWNSANIQDPSGKRVIATIAQGQDITERKKTEEALEHSERRHRTLVETAPEVIYTVTEDGNIASLNSAFEKITGYSRDEWIGKPFGSLIHPDDLPLALEKFQQSLRGENPSLFNLRVRAKSGEYLIGEFTSVPQMEKGIVWGLARDISERKKTEEALIDSERRASRAQEIAHLGSWELDLAGNRLSWSDEVYRIFGLQPQRFSATYEAFLEAVHPDDRATVDAAYYGSVRDGREGYEIEHRIVRKSDGQVRVVHERCEHVRDGSGRIVRSVGMVHDITERKKAEQALEESEERFRVIAETSPIQISVSRALDGTILFTNPAYDDAFGFAKGELIGQKAPNLYFDPADRAALIGTVKKQGFVRNYEVRVKRKDGTPFWVIASISTVGFGGEQAILGASVDITENKKMQQAIERAGREWERTFDSVPDLIAILDKQHRIVRANLAMAQKLRLTPQKCSGLTCFECVHGTQGPPDVCPHAQTMKDGLEHAAELHEDRLGGDFLVTTTPLKDEQGQMVGSVHVARNITESKRLQEKLEQYTKHLEQLVEERTQKLKDAQRLATIGEVAAMVGHDIRNPLQSIEGALFLAKKELESLPPETQQTATLKEMVSTIQEESGYVDKIVSDLQDYARPLAPKAEQFDLEQLVAKTLMSVAIPESIETSTAIEDGCRIMTADFTMMKRIVTNLTTNAIQAMPHGGRLTIGATRIDGEIRITFQDTGEGISDDMKPRIFQPLFSTKAKGQGFGLAVVKRLVEGLKGQITFDSEVGKGTTFTVTIPIKQETKQ